MTVEKRGIAWRWISSMEKVFPEMEPEKGWEDHAWSMLSNEMFSFQCAYLGEGNVNRKIFITAKGRLSDYVRIREVCLMPSRYPGPSGCEGPSIPSAPGLYPDLLRDIKNGWVWLYPGQWQSLYITIDFGRMRDSEIPYGRQKLVLILEDRETGESAEAEISIRIRKGKLPVQKLYHTEWFHTDCLADYYGMEPWSEAYWDLLGHYLAHYGRMGMNMILVPTFTPPLDTAIGGERTTVQLVDVECEGEHYRFGFSKLERFFKMCREAGIAYFEIAHLFTQWGAKAAPKVMVRQEGKEVRIFGWETEAQSPAYLSFLKQYLPALTHKLDDWGLCGRVFFHLSDEPEEENLETYAALRNQVSALVSGYPVLDAVSRYSFYERGVVDCPVPAMDHMEPFLKHKVPHLWTYYCCAQSKHVPNRFFAMPLARTRALGLLLYYFRIEGFLHWGYNFYNSQYSLEHLNPYAVTDAGGAFPSGDAFLVYPGRDGYPEDSLRMMAIAEAMQDLRALEALESLSTREDVIHLVEELADGPFTMTEYPMEGGFYCTLRETVNGLLESKAPLLKT